MSETLAIRLGSISINNAYNTHIPIAHHKNDIV